MFSQLCTSRHPLKMLGNIPPSTQCHIPIHYSRNLTCSSVYWYSEIRHSKCCGGSTLAFYLGYSRVVASAADETSWLRAFVDFLSTSNYITTISFHVLSSSLFTVHPLTQCYTFWGTNSVNQRSYVTHYVARRNHFQCYLWKQQSLTLPTSCTSCSCRSCDNVWCRRASCSGVSPSLSGMFRFDPSRTSSCKRTYCR